MKIELEVSEENEGTAAPWWAIIDPRQSMKADYQAIASMITGPFFSREAAQDHLQARHYNFGKRAVVYCFSGCWSRQYETAIRKVKK